MREAYDVQRDDIFIDLYDKIASALTGQRPNQLKSAIDRWVRIGLRTEVLHPGPGRELGQRRGPRSPAIRTKWCSSPWPMTVATTSSSDAVLAGDAERIQPSRGSR